MGQHLLVIIYIPNAQLILTRLGPQSPPAFRPSQSCIHRFHRPHFASPANGQATTPASLLANSDLLRIFRQWGTSLVRMQQHAIKKGKTRPKRERKNKNPC